MIVVAVTIILKSYILKLSANHMLMNSTLLYFTSLHFTFTSLHSQDAMTILLSTFQLMFFRFVMDFFYFPILFILLKPSKAYGST